VKGKQSQALTLDFNRECILKACYAYLISSFLLVSGRPRYLYSCCNPQVVGYVFFKECIGYVMTGLLHALLLLFAHALLYDGFFFWLALLSMFHCEY